MLRNQLCSARAPRALAREARALQNVSFVCLCVFGGFGGTCVLLWYWVAHAIS
eukprot:NODE_638_length_832_cov_6.270754_g482_i0.p3 GENE.NODE_638_length_832_cov_6.270754_g482_i0~~NODE_638_length_832_cov_6.270754_g482_i0.p3  ORF type:complete len:53 (-),score=1.72 NODE_638_length_832_cov_6.270754_g482_i0:215-373(-)